MRTLHVGLRVADLSRSIAFYRSLGYEVLGDVHPEPSVNLTMLKLPDDDFVSLELVHDETRDRIDSSGVSHLVISVETMERTVADLGARGVPVEASTSPDGSDDFLTAWVTDPDGFRIELVQWPSGHPSGMTRADLEPDGARSDGNEPDA